MQLQIIQFWIDNLKWYGSWHRQMSAYQRFISYLLMLLILLCNIFQTIYQIIRCAAIAVPIQMTIDIIRIVCRCICIVCRSIAIFRLWNIIWWDIIRWFLRLIQINWSIEIEIEAKKEQNETNWMEARNIIYILCWAIAV